MVFDSTDLKATFNNKYFSTSENMKTSLTTSESKNSTTKNSTSGNSTTENPTSNSSTTESENRTQNNNSESSSTDKETSILEESIYPMYLPSGTYLSDEETVSKEDGDRIILTFAGESPFILVEESVNASQEMEIIPVYGEPTILMDTVGALSESSVNFISNGVEYYIASESLTMQEIIQVAESISTLPVMK